MAALVRYGLLLVVLAAVTTYLHVTDSERSLESVPATDSVTQAHDTKPLLRQEVKTAPDARDVAAGGEERAFIGSYTKNVLYELLAKLRVTPQTIAVHLGIKSGRAPAVVHRFYNSYHRWFAAHGRF
ncbi:hypothetical protein PHYSODRAFT_307763 [Phytophthora sojae]|uniref:RxLR effector protein n=1 Tax=Phytophthora sojae (strain P6497) TaxID=1094619 RepID=G5AFZ1_PHYSP|nr:hypothetical protein PHYSODRAFT_307763 [Phytophthora sojae]EGZ05503.1 hypothetical protein PHYSODRAFT_307763 [Phytophthora sojae]|eukprot:XP_009539034.1 hypothetical protein PHYSODRAFT_307763 [Phytophthora sojae]